MWIFAYGIRFDDRQSTFNGHGNNFLGELIKAKFFIAAYYTDGI